MDPQAYSMIAGMAVTATTSSLNSDGVFDCNTSASLEVMQSVLAVALTHRHWLATSPPDGGHRSEVCELALIRVALA